jgi:hypothetical protein
MSPPSQTVLEDLRPSERAGAMRWVDVVAFFHEVTRAFSLALTNFGQCDPCHRGAGPIPVENLVGFSPPGAISANPCVATQGPG